MDRRLLSAALRLPPRVGCFYLRAQLLARRNGDDQARLISSRPEDLVPLLAIARGRRHVVELGTGAGWTAAALVLADRHRRVLTYDPVTDIQREPYLALIGHRDRARIEIRSAPAARGPAEDDPPVELLFIDIGGHTRIDAMAAFSVWRPALAPGAAVAFHDYGPEFPGVAQAVAELGLRGEVIGRCLFVWRAPSSGASER